MAKLTIEVCDTCKDPKREVSDYTVEGDGKKVKKTLCAIHARPLLVLLGEAKPAGRPPARTRSRVTTIEEIEAGKKK